MFLAVAFAFGCRTAQKGKPIAHAPAPPPAVKPSPAPEQASKSQPAPAPPLDAEGKLIQDAESLYAKGMEEYRQGNLQKAKDDFDQALSLLLDSPFDLTTDQRLNDEFDKLTETIHGLEVSTAGRGETLAEHHYEPAPIESFQGLTFPVDPNVKQRVQEEVKKVQSDLPLVSNDLVAGVITYFQGGGSEFIDRVLTRVGLYQPTFTEVLRKEGVPEEMLYLAAGESGFNPSARSRKGAVGIWQFMIGTASLYGLRKDRWVDERQDPVKSTQAAARYLRSLYETFGDWLLAMAAYDSGAGTVERAIEKTGYADFWTLRRLHALPPETENYVPIFLATAIIAKDPKNYGFDIHPSPPLDVDKITVNVSTDLRLVAQLIDHPVDELVQLNPSLLWWTTPPNGREFALNLPKGTGDTFLRAVASIPPQNRVWWRTHKVSQGETLTAIASKYRVSRAALSRANQLETGATLEAGQMLVLPLSPGNETSLVRVHERRPTRAVRYRVRPGDTLDLIADRFDVTPYEIRLWNGLHSSRINAGQSLKLYTGRGRSTARARPKSGRGPTPRKAAAEAPTGPAAPSTAGAPPKNR